MSLVRMLRALWLPALVDVTGPVKSAVRDWLLEGEYQVSHSTQGNRFSLDITANQPLLNAFAADINRMASSAFETLLGIQKHPVSPSSSGWLIIETYYAAFFAAHALLRMFGVSVTQLDWQHTITIHSIANKYGQTSSIKPHEGTYTCQFEPPKAHLDCHLLAQKGGVHQVFWSVFANEVNKWSNDVLLINTETSLNKQAVSARLLALVDNLRGGGSSTASWLSQVRNSVNYRHELGCWFPHKYERPSYSRLHDHVRLWLNDPLSIDLTVLTDQDLKGFQNTCSCIVAIARELTEELAERSRGKSFTSYRPIKLLNFAHQPRQ